MVVGNVEPQRRNAMKRVLAVLVLMIAVIPIGARGLHGANPADPQQPRKKRIAVLDFDFATVQSSSAALFGNNVDVGKGITDLLITNLVKDGTYSVIERQAINKILAEQNFSNSDRANPASAAKIGKLLGVDAIIVGAITQFGNDDSHTNVGGGGGGFGGFGLGKVGIHKSKAIVAINARLVDIDTGEILGVAEGKGDAERDGASILGGGGNWHGFGAGGVDFGNSNFQQTIIGEAVKKAVDNLTTDVISDNTKLQTRTIVVDGLVADVDASGGTVVLNVGAKNGLKVGDQLSVERVTREVKDPATGAVLRRISSPIGVIQVTDVDDNSAVAKIISGAGFKIGDHAKTTAQ
jgi:curli biogenesis system outer membrane secretion channel CsgG